MSRAPHTDRSLCPEWRELAHRARATAGADWHESAEWQAALVHHDGGCAACRDAAYAVEPLLVFRRTPAVRVENDDVAAMRLAVAAMRRAERVAPASATSAATATDLLGGLPSAPPAARAGWRRTAVAASLAALLIATAAPRSLGPSSRANSPVDAPVAAALDNPAFEISGPAAASTSGEIGTVDRPTASVYHLDGPDMDVMMVVDAGLDV